MSPLREHSIFPKSLMMGPGVSKIGGSHVIDAAEASATLTVTVSAASGALWTPASITTSLWLDAADADTITLNGSTVSQWSDKSGNARHAAQGTAASQPAYSTNELNSLPVFTFASDFMTLPTDSLRTVLGGATAVIDVCVCRVTATSTTGQRIYQHEGTVAGDNGYWAKLVGVSNYAVSSGVYDGSWQQASHVTGSGWRIDSAEYVGGVAFRAYDFGILTASDTSVGAAIATPVAGSAAVIGATNNSTTRRYFLGQIAERVLIVGGVADRQKVEGYLAHKWGLADSLPSDHPYKSAAPTI